MLTFEQKQQIFARFDELEEKSVSMGRLNYHFEGSKREKTLVIKHLHPNGNAWLYAPFLERDDLDKEGYLNIRDLSESEIEQLLKEAIGYLSTDGDPYQEGFYEWYQDGNGDALKLSYENKMWIIYTGENVEAVFPTREAALGYLADEGFQD
ncbi:hypothetical protein [Listeria costaricensis]|uniref:hypothetical protein n=1 Tax=Listeria costaricensis TaxID=2026604 RepID=UPI000C06BA04|nr:hypothetical protein [Listeria costaricensis]